MDKKEVIENYEREMELYKSKKFELQKDLECVFYGLAEKARTDRLRNEEEHMLKKDELKNSVSFCFTPLQQNVSCRALHNEQVYYF